MFINLPQHLQERICSEVYSKDRVKLSTCHSTLHSCCMLEHIVLDTVGPDVIRSFCAWLTKRPKMLKYLSIYDTAMVFGTKEHIVDILIASLEVSGTCLEDLIMRAPFPLERLLPKLPSLKTVQLASCRFPQDVSLASNIHLTTIHISSGLNVTRYSDPTELKGITDAKGLEELVIHDHDGCIELTMIEKLQALVHLEIIGLEYSPRVVRDIRQIRHLKKLKHLILDSQSIVADIETLSALTHLETLDLSRRNVNYDWFIVEPLAYHARVIDYVERMPFLRTFGCRDCILDASVRSHSIERLYFTCRSLVQSLHHGLDVRSFPALRHMYVESAYSEVFDEGARTAFVLQLCKHPSLESITLRHPHENYNYHKRYQDKVCTQWFSIASHCPSIVFRVE